MCSVIRALLIHSAVVSHRESCSNGRRSVFDTSGGGLSREYSFHAHQFQEGKDIVVDEAGRFYDDSGAGLNGIDEVKDIKDEVMLEREAISDPERLRGMCQIRQQLDEVFPVSTYDDQRAIRQPLGDHLIVLRAVKLEELSAGVDVKVQSNGQVQVSLQGASTDPDRSSAMMHIGLKDLIIKDSNDKKLISWKDWKGIKVAVKFVANLHLKMSKGSKAMRFMKWIKGIPNERKPKTKLDITTFDISLLKAGSTALTFAAKSILKIFGGIIERAVSRMISDAVVTAVDQLNFFQLPEDLFQVSHIKFSIKAVPDLTQCGIGQSTNDQDSCIMISDLTADTKLSTGKYLHEDQIPGLLNELDTALHLGLTNLLGSVLQKPEVLKLPGIVVNAIQKLSMGTDSSVPEDGSPRSLEVHGSANGNIQGQELFLHVLEHFAGADKWDRHFKVAFDREKSTYDGLNFGNGGKDPYYIFGVPGNHGERGIVVVKKPVVDLSGKLILAAKEEQGRPIWVFHLKKSDRSDSLLTASIDDLKCRSTTQDEVSFFKDPDWLGFDWCQLAGNGKIQADVDMDVSGKFDMLSGEISLCLTDGCAESEQHLTQVSFRTTVTTPNMLIHVDSANLWHVEVDIVKQLQSLRIVLHDMAKKESLYGIMPWPQPVDAPTSASSPKCSSKVAKKIDEALVAPYNITWGGTEKMMEDVQRIHMLEQELMRLGLSRGIIMRLVDLEKEGNFDYIGWHDEALDVNMHLSLRKANQADQNGPIKAKEGDYVIGANAKVKLILDGLSSSASFLADILKWAAYDMVTMKRTRHLLEVDLTVELTFLLTKNKLFGCLGECCKHSVKVKDIKFYKDVNQESTLLTWGANTALHYLMPWISHFFSTILVDVLRPPVEMFLATQTISSGSLELTMTMTTTYDSDMISIDVQPITPTLDVQTRRTNVEMSNAEMSKDTPEFALEMSHGLVKITPSPLVQLCSAVFETMFQQGTHLFADGGEIIVPVRASIDDKMVLSGTMSPTLKFAMELLQQQFRIQAAQPPGVGANGLFDTAAEPAPTHLEESCSFQYPKDRIPSSNRLVDFSEVVEIFPALKTATWKVSEASVTADKVPGQAVSHKFKLQASGAIGVDFNRLLRNLANDPATTGFGFAQPKDFGKFDTYNMEGSKKKKTKDIKISCGMLVLEEAKHNAKQVSLGKGAKVEDTNGAEVQERTNQCIKVTGILVSGKKGKAEFLLCTSPFQLNELRQAIDKEIELQEVNDKEPKTPACEDFLPRESDAFSALGPVVPSIGWEPDLVEFDGEVSRSASFVECMKACKYHAACGGFSFFPDRNPDRDRVCMYWPPDVPGPDHRKIWSGR